MIHITKWCTTFPIIIISSLRDEELRKCPNNQMRRTQIYSQNYTNNFLNKTIDKCIGLIQIAPIQLNQLVLFLAILKLPFFANILMRPTHLTRFVCPSLRPSRRDAQQKRHKYDCGCISSFRKVQQFSRIVA